MILIISLNFLHAGRPGVTKQWSIINLFNKDELHKFLPIKEDAIKWFTEKDRLI